MTKFDQRRQRVKNQYNAGRDINLHQTVIPSLSEAEQRYNRREMLKRVQVWRVDPILDRAFHEIDRIPVEFHYQLNEEVNPWKSVVQESNKPLLPLSPDLSITQVYDQSGGQLLILGGPGTGKTISLLELARNLLDKAVQDDFHPIPVIFDLLSWGKKRKPLAEWLVEELNDKYRVPEKVAQAWIRNNSLTVLLDGFDQLAIRVRQECIHAINAYLRQQGFVSIVVCSRLTDYLHQKVQLDIQRIITIQPLAVKQVLTHLSQRRGLFTIVQDTLHHDPILQELLTTPLMLSVFMAAYQDVSIEQDVLTGTLEERRQKIFSTYIQQMFKRRGIVRYSEEKTVQPLQQLAKYMKQTHQEEFFIEHIQFDWLTEEHARQARRLIVGGCALLLGLIAALGGFLITAPRFGQFIGVFNGITYGLPTGLTTLFVFRKYLKQNLTILPAEVGHWSWKSAWKEIGNNIRFITKIVNITIIIDLFLVGMREGFHIKESLAKEALVGWIAGLGLPLVVSLTLGIMFGLRGGWSSGLLEKSQRVRPNQGMRRSLYHSLIWVIISGSIAVVDTTVLTWLGDRLIPGLDNSPQLLINPLFIGLIFGICTALSSGLNYGGLACIQHYILRVFLQFEGKMPLDAASFLDHAAERILLDKVGGGYKFIHSLLQDYFSGNSPTLSSEELAQPVRNKTQTTQEIIAQLRREGQIRSYRSHSKNRKKRRQPKSR